MIKCSQMILFSKFIFIILAKMKNKVNPILQNMLMKAKLKIIKEIVGMSSILWGLIKYILDLEEFGAEL